MNQHGVVADDCCVMIACCDMKACKNANCTLIHGNENPANPKPHEPHLDERLVWAFLRRAIVTETA